jgi:hypothetical protein
MMKKDKKGWLKWTGISVLLLGVMITAVLASKGLAETVHSGIGPIETLILKESENQTSWSTSIGTLTDGYSVALDGTKPFYKYLDVETLIANPALKVGTYDFYFDHLRVPDGYWAYWAAKGVDENATGDWQAVMWDILNGRTPMFYLEVSAGGSEFHLLDGLLKEAFGDSIPLRVSQDYPLATYHYGGWVTDANDDETYINVQMTFTKEAEVSLRVESPDTWTIDGCGYLDVYIHLANMHDLYALDIALAFDPDILEVVDLILDDPLDPFSEGINLEPVAGWFDAGYWAVNKADNTAGTIQYATTQKRPAEPVSGAGDVAKIRFRAKALAVDTPVAIEKAEFSDRDSFLVGRPVVFTDPAAEITTTFSTDAGLDLDIIRLDASTVQLQWPKPAVNSGIEGYVLHKSKLPYFELGEADFEITTGFDETGDPITYDDEVLGDVIDNWFYALQLTCENDFASPLSWQVGKFEFELFETPTTDFSMIGLIFDNPNLVKAQDLGNHIENNLYTGSVDVLTISTWNPVAQTFTSYVYTTIAPGFDIFSKQAYRVEIDIDGVTSGSVIWAQVGKLPEITPDTYTLYQTATTDFNWILQPLDMVSITNTTQLAEAIEASASGEVEVLSIALWNPVAQSLTSYIRPHSSTTRFGYPYRVEVKIKDGHSVVWPVD